MRWAMVAEVKGAPLAGIIERDFSKVGAAALYCPSWERTWAYWRTSVKAGV
jgi:hypothetical protein